MKIIATSPGDIVIEIKIPETNKHYVVPLKSISCTKSMESSKEYGVGSHQAYAEVVGKIGYEGDFTIGSWYCDDENNPSTWDNLVTLLTYQDDEGLPKEFTINVHARSGDGMTRVGTGTYADTGQWKNSTQEDAFGTGDVIPGSNNEAAAAGGSSDMVIMSFYRCILRGDSVDIPETGGVVTRKYPFSCLFRMPR
jgi:hypothetical protein